MESPKNMSSVFGFAALMRSFETQAKAAGFESHVEWLASRDAEVERERQVEADAKERERRSRACRAVVGRVPDSVLAGIVAKAPSTSTKALEAARAWFGSDRPTLVLCGGVGAGKTVAAIRVMVDAGVTAQFVRAVQIGAHWERWTSDRESHVPPLDVGCGFLVVDDLGHEPLEDRRSMAALEEIVDARQSMRRRTVFTTNLSNAQILERYSERIRSRWAQSARVIRIDADDARRL